MLILTLTAMAALVLALAALRPQAKPQPVRIDTRVARQTKRRY